MSSPGYMGVSNVSLLTNHKIKWLVATCTINEIHKAPNKEGASIKQGFNVK